MPEFRERPKLDKPRPRPSNAMHPKQAARMMKEKYLQQLDQRPEGTDSETNYAADRVEEAGQRAADEAVAHRPRRRKRDKNPLKERRPAGDRSGPVKGETPQAGPQKPKDHPTTRPKERETVTPKARQHAQQGATSITKGKAKARAQARQEAVNSQPIRQKPPMETPEARFSPPGPTLASGTSRESKAPKGKPQRAVAFKERPSSAIKTRSSPAVKSSAPAMKVKPPAARTAKKAARQTVQRQMTQRMVAQAQRAAKATMTAAKKTAEAVVRAAAALVSGLVGLLGGGVLVVILLLVAVVAAIVSSPFGLFFAKGGDPDTVSVAEAIAQVSREYNAKLEELQAGSYDSIELAGAAADWPDVLAVFASRYAAAEDGVDVATLDADRVDKLTATFWDMTAITSTVETIDHPDSDPDDDTDDSWTERILHLTITAKTAEDMKTAYGLTAYQISAMDELLADRTALSSLAGSLAITNVDALTVLNALPDDLSPDRRKAVETALQLAGKVNYFWGGKSYAIGWDSRWGQLAKVTADGNSTTGTFRPFGLDGTGFMDWTLRNAGLPSDGHWYIGANLTEVPQAEALPGDMALYPDASHIGMVVGRDSAGKLLICHCSSGANNVVVTEFAASGFTTLGRPAIYAP